MLIHIDPKSSTPIYEQIIQQVKEWRLKGILQDNEKIPSIRELSSQLLVNPNTVSRAYQELERQNVIVTIRGKGTFIAEQAPSVNNEEKKEQLKNKLKQLIVEAKYLGISKEEWMSWVESQYMELGGEANARSTKVNKDHT
ncbi:GntR family transcriptional regulator [Longirhabdus pacifica]|uniref:GntR family transcriptional regulator n=1 Tax=Longirhabdus pacifica TaxID=2305227 RepID=UPI00197DA4D3|nr:GntR family transcriptional regulator [Longirhabdus pacifica]